MKNKKGFTLIELLAVIIILGVLMIIAIPSVTEYIQNSRKEAYVKTVNSFSRAVMQKVNEGKMFKFYDSSLAYFVPVSNVEEKSCISLESGGTNPYGEWLETYIIVTYDGRGYSYYFTSNDTANFGVDLTEVSKLDVDMIKPNHKVEIPLNGEIVTIGDGDYYATVISASSCSSVDSGVETIDKSDLRYTVDNGEIIIDEYLGDKKNIKIPDTIDGMVVKEIGESAFETKELTRVELPNQVRKINNYAFTRSQLKILNIPSTVEYIGKYAFEYSTITKLVIPGSVKTIERGAFNDSPLTKLVLNEGIIDIGRGAFGYSKLTELKLPSTLVTIGDYAFEYSKLSSLVIPASVTEIGEAAFGQSEISSLVVKGKGNSDCLSVGSGKFTRIGSSPFGYASGYNERDVVCER